MDNKSNKTSNKSNTFSLDEFEDIMSDYVHSIPMTELHDIQTNNSNVINDISSSHIQARPVCRPHDTINVHTLNRCIQLSEGNDYDVINTVHSIPIKRKEIKILSAPARNCCREAWLNDEIINAVGSLAQAENLQMVLQTSIDEDVVY